MRKTDPTHKIEPTKFDWWLQRVGGSRKPPPISLPRIRALETPAEPSDPKQPEGRPSACQWPMQLPRQLFVWSSVHRPKFLDTLGVVDLGSEHITL